MHARETASFVFGLFHTKNKGCCLHCCNVHHCPQIDRWMDGYHTRHVHAYPLCAIPDLTCCGCQPLARTRMQM
jgi:hypothetical protein